MAVFSTLISGRCNSLKEISLKQSSITKNAVSNEAGSISLSMVGKKGPETSMWGYLHILQKSVVDHNGVSLSKFPLQITFMYKY